MLRAAELCLEFNFRYFTILGNESRGGTDKIDLGSSSTTTGTITPFGTYRETTDTTQQFVYVYKPGKAMRIQCFDTPPQGHFGRIFDAAQLRAEIRVRYKLPS